MNKKQLRALMAVNLRLVNPQVTDRYRKKGKSGSALTKKLGLQFLTNTLIFLLIYGATMFSVDFSKLPGMFTFYVALFVLLSFSQSISGIYNIFFAGKDLASYLPLPFRQQEIFLSKVLIVAFNVFPFTLPLLLVFILTGWKAGMLLPVAIVVGLVAYLLIMAIILLLCSLIVFGLTKTKLFREHQNSVINGLMVVTTLIAIAGIVLINHNTGSSDGLNRPSLGIFLPLFQLFTDSFSMVSGITWLSLLVALVVLGFIIKVYVLPHLSEQLTQANNAFMNSSKKHKQTQHRGLKQNLDQYNLQLLKEPNLLLQVVLNSVMVPLVFTISFGFAKVPSNLTLKWFGVFFVAGVAFSLLTTNQVSLIGNLISLDRMNFEFVKTLPISMRAYLQRKFRLGYLFQLVINIVLIVILAVVLKISLVMMLIMILGTILGTYLVCLHFFRRDYQLRVTNWTNITELFNRGGGNLGMVVTMFANILLGTLVIVAYGAVIYLIPQPALVNTVAGIIIVIASFWCWRHYQQEFWKKLQ